MKAREVKRAKLVARYAEKRVDYVCVVDAIGIPEKIATGAAKPTTDTRKIMMADYCTQVVINTPYFKEGFSGVRCWLCRP